MNTPPAEPAPAAPPRLVSLDALRGFDMFWILGADSIAYALRDKSSVPLSGFFATQLDHAAWEGFTFYDLIFPLFVFIVGVSLVFALPRTIAQQGRGAAMKRILVRSLLLFAFGVFYNGGLSREWPEVRLAGVLQRIAIAYAVTGILFCYFRPRVLAAVGAVLLIGFWALLTFVPIRDVTLETRALEAQLGMSAEVNDRMPSESFRTRVRDLYATTTTTVSGRYESGLNLANHVDYVALPGAMYDIYWDPEGLLSTLPAIATCLMGVFAGLGLRRVDWSAHRKVVWLAAGGGVALVLGYAWGLQFPIVKKIWTSSYVLVAGGWSLLLLAAFYYVVDVRGWRRWCTPFVWIGMNPITLYLATSVVGFHGIARRFMGGSVERFFNDRVAAGSGDLVIAAVSLLLLILLARFLHRRGIFLRV